jgi:hypothetical protein
MALVWLKGERLAANVVPRSSRPPECGFPYSVTGCCISLAKRLLIVTRFYLCIDTELFGLETCHQNG